MLKLTLTSVALLGAAALLPAQTIPRLVTLTAGTLPPGPVIGTLDRLAPCNPLTKCVPAVPAPALNPVWAGGVAWSARHGGAWATDGKQLALHDLVTTAVPCNVLCGPGVIPAVAAAEFVTGLGVNESTNTLWMTISDGIANRMGRYSNACPPAVGGSCPLPVPAGMIVAGLDSADAAGLVVYTASLFAGAPNNTIFFAPQTAPCSPICVRPVPNCSATTTLGPITGVAVEEDAYGPGLLQFRVYVTDGRTVEALKYDPTTCTVTTEFCCTNGFQDRLVGLGVVPSRATRMGANCSTGACPVCPTMEHVAIGDPAIGNPAFTLQLNNAPAASIAYMLLNFGPCTAPGVFSPPFCAPVLVPVAGWIAVGPLATGGGVGCTGSAGITLSVPLNTAFCGAVFSSQYVVLCGGLFSNAISNCLTWMISAT